MASRSAALLLVATGVAGCVLPPSGRAALDGPKAIADSSAGEARGDATLRPTYRWQRQIGGSSFDSPVGLAIDRSGRVALGARVAFDSVDFGGEPLPLGAWSSAVATYAKDGTYRWGHGLSGSTTQSAVYVSTVAVAPDGELAVGGSFDSTTDFGAGPVAPVTPVAGFLARYAEGGALLSLRQFATTSTLSHPWVLPAYDASGSLLAAVQFVDSVDVGGGPIASAGNYDVALVSFAGDGSPRWTQLLRGAGDDTCAGVLVDGGRVYLSGRFDGDLQVAGQTLSSAGEDEAFVAAFEVASGAPGWARRFGGEGDELAGPPAASGGGVVVMIPFEGQVDFGGVVLTAAGAHDSALLALSASGATRWARRLGAYASVAADATGNLYLAGAFGGTAFLGGAEATAVAQSDLFVASFAPSGAHRWTVTYPGKPGSQGVEMALAAAGPNGALVVTGTFFDTLALPGGTLSSKGAYDLFLLGLALP